MLRNSGNSGDTIPDSGGAGGGRRQQGGASSPAFVISSLFEGERACDGPLLRKAVKRGSFCPTFFGHHAGMTLQDDGRPVGDSAAAAGRPIEEILFDEQFTFIPDSSGIDEALLAIMEAIKTRLEELNSPWVSIFVLDEHSPYAGEAMIFIGKYPVVASILEDVRGERKEVGYILAFVDILTNSFKATCMR